MVKNDQDVISEFNEYVNMTASELEKWLKSDDSNSAGWPKNEGEEGGESVGHDSGRKIVEILKSNPNKDPEKYTEDQIQHMRKVASYCKRHLAQESAGHKDKSPEEVKKTKSYASLKNWGHDPLKNKDQNGTSSKSNSGRQTRSNNSKSENNNDEEDEDDAASDEQEKSAGDKRKKSGAQAGAKKKRETRKGAGSKKDEEEDDDDENEDEDEDEGVEEDDEEEDEDVEMAEDDDDEEEEEEEEDDEEENGNDDTEKQKKSTGGRKGQKKGSGKQQNGGGAKAKKGPKKGEEVSWNWGGGQPTGKVLDVKGEEASIITKRGNTVSRKGDPEDPAVVLDTGKSKAIKSAHELN